MTYLTTSEKIARLYDVDLQQVKRVSRVKDRPNVFLAVIEGLGARFVSKAKLGL